MDAQRLMLIKHSLVQTVSTQGWAYVKKMAANVVEQAINEALEEEDPQKGESKRLKARALQKGFSDLFNAIETTTQLEPMVDDGNPFAALEMEN